jgi:putative ABC transport system substrate-binding protein
MNRRAFIAGLGGAAVWPLVADAQATPVVGFLSNELSEAPAYAAFVAAFRRGLGEVGYIEDRSVVIDFRSSNNQISRLPDLVKAMVQKPVSVIVAAGGDSAIQAAISGTSTIPIVALIGSDSIESGLSVNLSRPDRNLTGVNVFAVQLVPTRFRLVREVLPNASLIAFLANPTNVNSIIDSKDFTGEAKLERQRVLILTAESESECDAAFARAADVQASALLVASDLLFNRLAERLVALARRYSVPVMYPRREFAVAGGLMSYGTSLREAYRQAGIYTGRILQGIQPADLPVWQATAFEFVINLKTARELGLTIPAALLARADEVIE